MGPGEAGHTGPMADAIREGGAQPPRARADCDQCRRNCHVSTATGVCGGADCGGIICGECMDAEEAMNEGWICGRCTAAERMPRGRGRARGPPGATAPESLSGSPLPPAVLGVGQRGDRRRREGATTRHPRPDGPVPRSVQSISTVTAVPMAPHPAGGVATGQVGGDYFSRADFLRARARSPSNYLGTDGTRGRGRAGIRVLTICHGCTVDIDCATAVPMAPHPTGGVATGRVGGDYFSRADFLRARGRSSSSYLATDGTGGRGGAGIRRPGGHATICKVDIDCYGGTDDARAARTGGRGLF